MNKVTAALRALLGTALLTMASAAPPAYAQAAFGPLLNKPTPALAEFERRYRGLTDYAATAVVFEQLNDGSRVETRTYAYKVVTKPAAAQASILSGSGKGWAAAWRGGDTVRFHQGGALAPIKLRVAIDDPRVQSLRGDTIDTGTFGYDLQFMLATPGVLSEAPGPTIAGVATIAVTLRIKDPAVATATKVTLDLSTLSHLPVRRQLYVGSTVMKTETFEGTRVDVGSRAQDIDI